MDLMPDHHLRIGVMQPVAKPELRVALWLPNGPAGEAARHFDDVLLRISAIDAERMKLHQLAAVIFVQAALLPFRLVRIRGGRGERPRHAEWAAESCAIRSARRLFLLQAGPGL